MRHANRLRAICEYAMGRANTICDMRYVNWRSATSNCKVAFRATTELNYVELILFGVHSLDCFIFTADKANMKHHNRFCSAEESCLCEALTDDDLDVISKGAISIQKKEKLSL